MPSTNEAIKVFKKRGLSYGGHIATLAMDSLFNGLELQRRPLPTGDPALLDERIREAVDLIYEESKAAAKEYNIRGDITSGAVIAGFLKVADVMVAHGAV
jgi:glutamate dehydrogenase (NADP+)